MIASLRKAGGGGLGGAPTSEQERTELLSKDNFLFQGIHMFRSCIETTKQWYAHYEQTPINQSILLKDPSS